MVIVKHIKVWIKKKNYHNHSCCIRNITTISCLQVPIKCSTPLIVMFFYKELEKKTNYGYFLMNNGCFKAYFEAEILSLKTFYCLTLLFSRSSKFPRMFIR